MKNLLTTKQAAEKLGYSEITLRKSRVSGLLGGTKAPKYKKIGRAVRYDQKDLESWVSDESHED